MGFQKILAALDYSPLSESVFDQALDLAKANEASLRLLHCLSNEMVGEPIGTLPIELGFYPEYVGYAYRSAPTLASERLDKTREWLSNYCETAKRQGVTVDFDCQVGEPTLYLCQMAQNWNADLLVLGRRGRTGLAEALMGSVSNYVMHHAPCSVLIVQPPDLGASDSQPNE